MSEDIKCELDRLMDLFKEPEKELTQDDINDLQRLERIRNERN